MQKISLTFLLVTANLVHADHVPDQILIKWKTRKTLTQTKVALKLPGAGKNAAPIIKEIQIEKEKEISALGWELWKLPPGENAGAMTAQLRENPDIEAVELNHWRRPVGVVPNDPLLNKQKHLDLIRAPAGWEFSVADSTNVTIAVIDTGVKISHVDISSKVWTNPVDSTADNVDQDGNGYRDDINGFNFEDNNNNVTDIVGHGTQVAGIAAATANNAIGIAGVAWGARLLPLQVFTNSCQDDPPCASDDKIAEALAYAVWAATATHRAYTGRMIINMSLGGTTPNALLQNAINLALSNNVLVVAAKGNFGDSTPVYPSDYAGVIGVGYTTAHDILATQSSYGAGADLVAPGVDIFSTNMLDSLYSNAGEGSSFACPQVAGAAALILSLLPTASTTQTQTVLIEGADDLGSPGRDDLYGYGRLNLLKTLRRAKFGTLSTFDGIEKAIAIPNPYKITSARQVTFSVPDAIARGSNPSVEIYDLGGSLIRDLQDFSWDGKNQAGAYVASGIYIFYIQTNRGQAQGRLIVENGI